MARIILKSPYLKPNSKTHMDNYVRHVAYHGGVERPKDSRQLLPSTVFQKKTVAQIIKNHPDTVELYEYSDYLKNPTRRGAEEFIIRAVESHPELLESREQYVSYIATRPGAVHIAGHGLFGDSDQPVILDHVMDEVKNHTGNVWCHIISLRREDAERLGYDSVSAWQDLLCSQRNIIAKAMNINPNNFRWYASFHNKEHHPHCHLVAWSAKPSEPWLTEKGINEIKKSLAKQIFKNDLMQTYERQTEHRDTLRRDSREIAAEIVRQINIGDYKNLAVEKLLVNLAGRLKNLSGKKVYGYLPPDVKAIVDRIVDELAKDENLAKLYDLWYEQKFDTVRTYTDTMPKKLPLSRNNEFKPIRNAVIEEAQNILLDRLTFEDTADEELEIDIFDEPNDEQKDIPISGHPDGDERNMYVQYRNAKRLLNKKSAEYNPQEAVRLLIGSAQENYQWAQYRLGKIFLSDDHVEQDVEYGLKWLWKAEAQSNQFARVLLGRAYLKGEIVPQDIAVAESMFESASKQGNADAQYALAKMHLGGKAENSSITKAIDLLEASASGDNEWAQYVLGKMLMRGEVITKDLVRAEQLLLSAVRRRSARDDSGELRPGNQYAAYLLGKLYLSEDEPIKNAEKAVQYLNESATQGNQYAQYQLGKMLLYGKEVEQDTVRGLELLNEASAQGNIYATKVIENYYIYRDRNQTNMKVSAALGSLRLLGHLARIIKNRLDEESRRDSNSGIIEKKLRRQIEIKKEAHGLKMGG